MHFSDLIFGNIISPPIICFFLGIALTLLYPSLSFPMRISKGITLYMLLSIGAKGGAPLIQHLHSNAAVFIIILGSLVVWGLAHPFLSFYMLRTFTYLDISTAAAVAACFGSISVMTFVTATAFLEQLTIDYQGLVIAVLAIMEIPAIISGIFLAKTAQEPRLFSITEIGKALCEALFNKAIFTIIIGLTAGAILYSYRATHISEGLLLFFKPALCIFLLDMGMRIGQYRHHFRSFSWSLGLFGFYMPLIGGGVGLLLSFMLNLDVGTGTLITVLTASASYIAVPAAMRIALPQAQEAVYLPLTLGITFPFNVIVGIPLYYQMASWLLA